MKPPEIIFGRITGKLPHVLAGSATGSPPTQGWSARGPASVGPQLLTATPVLQNGRCGSRRRAGWAEKERGEERPRGGVFSDGRGDPRVHFMLVGEPVVGGVAACYADVQFGRFLRAGGIVRNQWIFLAGEPTKVGTTRPHMGGGQRLEPQAFRQPSNPNKTASEEAERGRVRASRRGWRFGRRHRFHRNRLCLISSFTKTALRSGPL
jgi:hypothetical protein